MPTTTLLAPPDCRPSYGLALFKTTRAFVWSTVIGKNLQLHTNHVWLARLLQVNFFQSVFPNHGTYLDLDCHIFTEMYLHLFPTRQG